MKDLTERKTGSETELNHKSIRSKAKLADKICNFVYRCIHASTPHQDRPRRYFLNHSKTSRRHSPFLDHSGSCSSKLQRPEQPLNETPGSLFGMRGFGGSVLFEDFDSL